MRENRGRKVGISGNALKIGGSNCDFSGIIFQAIFSHIGKK